MKLGGFGYFHNWIFWSGFLLSVSNMQEFLYISMLKEYISYLYSQRRSTYDHVVVLDLTKVRTQKIHSVILVANNVRVQVGDLN